MKLRTTPPPTLVVAATAATAFALLTVGGVTPATAYAAEGVKPAATQTAASRVYRIEAGDVLDVTVIGEPELTKSVTVLPDGTIAYPYLGEARVEGLTLTELKGRITKALKDQIVGPQITIAIARRREKTVSVLGAVRTPGKRALAEGWGVLDVIADCGGLSVRPEWATATLVRNGGEESVGVELVRLLAQADPKDNLPVGPGDILLIKEKESSQTQVQVVGEVLKPGPIAASADGSIVAVLNAVGGPTPNAALAGAAILRGAQTLPVDLSDYADSGRAPAGARLEPGDTLVIPRNKRQYAVLGAVERPGAVNYPEGRTVDALTALSLSGGYSKDADLKNATILRAPANGAAEGQAQVLKVDLSAVLKNGNLAQNATIEPGDVLFVPSKGKPKLDARDALSLIPLLGFFLR